MYCSFSNPEEVGRVCINSSNLFIEIDIFILLESITNDSIIEQEQKILEDAEKLIPGIETLFFCYALNVNFNLLRFCFDNWAN